MGSSIIGGTRLNAIMGDEVIANSTHHQGISEFQEVCKLVPILYMIN